MMNKEEIIRVLKNFDEGVEKAELIRNPYGNNEDFKKILVYLTEEHCSIFKDTLDYIKNIEKENQQLKKSIKLFTDDLANMTNRALQLEKQKDDVVEYINFLYIINQNINGKFSDTLWGKEILELLGEIDE